MPAHWLRRFALVLVLAVAVVALAAVGSPGATYRTNTSFATCIEEAPAAADEEDFEVFAACSVMHCPENDPSRVATIGLWFYVRMNPDAPSCHEPPELIDVVSP
jgi:hypothetical protein